MDSVIVYSENVQQLSALKAFLKSMKMSFEQNEEEYPAHVVEGINRSLQEAKEGKVYPFASVRDMLR